jgi:hypothetical protein
MRQLQHKLWIGMMGIGIFAALLLGQLGASVPKSILAGLMAAVGAGALSSWSKQQQR